ncbi:hypothetical protein LCGC14_1305040 [marine sediment metagenome]|uniref:Uncharacterized protein n=1 Tax=marine sediment metagenome TaxID=412755 RepID=A0A0F9L8T6_9ZZZZ
MKKDIQTIEVTGKKWKGIQLIGIILILIGVVVAIATEGGGVGIFFLSVGFGMYAYSRIGAWWHHG